MVFGFSVSLAAFSGFSSLALGLLAYAAITGIRALLVWGASRSSILPERT